MMYSIAIKTTIFDTMDEQVVFDQIGPFEHEREADFWISRFWPPLDALNIMLGLGVCAIGAEMIISDYEFGVYGSSRPWTPQEAVDAIEEQYRQIYPELAAVV